MKRLFFALWPDDPLRNRLLRLHRGISKERMKLTKPDNLHITLVFLGDVDAVQEAAVIRGAGEISGQALQLTLDRLTLWRRPGILCLSASVQPRPLLELVDRLEKLAVANDIDVDTRPYKAHVTLARKARRKPEIDVEPLLWRADRFVLVESVATESGTHYQVAHSWPLQSAA